MTDKYLQSSLSAVMDNVANEFELRKVLAEANTDLSLQSKWSRYQLLRSIIRDEVVFPKLDIARAVLDTLEKEQSTTVRKPSFNWRNYSALAASVVIALTFVGYLLTSMDSTNPRIETGILAANNNYDQLAEKRLSSFLDRHEQQGVLSLDEKQFKILKAMAN